MIALVGNKLDMDPSRQVSLQVHRHHLPRFDPILIVHQAAQTYAEEANLLFAEVSARTGEGVSELFDQIARKLPKTEQQVSTPRMVPGVPLGASRGTAPNEARSCC